MKVPVGVALGAKGVGVNEGTNTVPVGVNVRNGVEVGGVSVMMGVGLIGVGLIGVSVIGGPPGGF
jgi:hypothetical protein